ncbi:MAG: DUF6673 family protein [Hungatella sp.]
MSQKWSYNGQEFEVDLQDADFTERYETSFNRMADEEKILQKAGTNSEIIRGYCMLFFHLFDGIYGQGTAEKLFGNKVNAGLCDDAYEAFLDAAKRNSQEAAQRRSESLARYAPKQKRQPHRKDVNEI